MNINRDILPDESVNIPKENPLVQAFRFGVSLFVFGSLILLMLNFLIKNGVDILSNETASKLMKATSSFVQIPASQDKNLTKIEQRLLKCSSSFGFYPKVLVVDSDEPNAFAFGDGNIYITKGLLKKANKEEEVAFVLGHELGHFKNRDHLKSLGFNLVIIFAKFLGVDVDSLGLSLSLKLQTTKYSQNAEILADRFGLEVLRCAYGRVDGAFSIFNKLKYQDKDNYLFSSHPSFKKRLELMREWKNIHFKGVDSAK
jgi:Zn-dependent protease with chaperone function